MLNEHSFNGELHDYNNNNGRNGSCFTWLAASLEEKRRWLIINASPRGHVLNKFRIWKERHIQMIGMALHLFSVTLVQSA